MKKLLAYCVLAACPFVAVSASTPTQAGTAVVAKIDISKQRMKVYVNGRHQYSWAVSTGAGRYRTPLGSYRPKFLNRKHFSRKYGNTPMPYSVFFHHGYAVHGTYSISRLGRRASHGCVRLHPSHAARLFRLVKRYGMRNSRIVIVR